MDEHLKILAAELKRPYNKVAAAVSLLDEGNTIPFIARYRKEMTGEMDEEVLRTLESRLNYLRNLAKRKEEITASITEQGKMTAELAEKIEKAQILQEVYKDFEAEKLVTNRRSAEMIKYASNDFLALKISYVNEIANLCEIVGADIEDVTKGMGFDARIGNRFLNAGIGYGGSCFPKDTKALSWLASFNDNELKTIKAAIEVNEIANLCEIVGADIEDVTKGMGFDARIGNRFLNAGIGYGGSCFPKDTKALSWLASFNDNELKTIKAAIEVNENQKMKLYKKARKYYDDFHGLTIAVLGLTFKPGTDDLREAPSLVNIPLFLEDGANIRAWDPVGVDNYKKYYPTELTYCDSIEDTLTGADLCLIFTEWKQIKEMDVTAFEKHMKRAIVLDGRNCFDLKAFRNTHVLYESIGRPVQDYLYMEEAR